MSDVLTIARVCAWCGTDLPAIGISAWCGTDLNLELQAVSHGICKACAKTFCDHLGGPTGDGTEARA